MFEDLIPDLQQPARELVRAAGEAGLQPRVTSTRRTHAAQARLYRRWQQGLSPFPASPPGTSEHEFGYAFDLVVTPFEALSDVGYTWQQWGGVWPGAADPVHFAYPGFVPPQQDTSTFTGYLSAEYQGVVDFIKTNAPTALQIASVFNLPLGIATTLWSLFSPKQ